MRFKKFFSIVLTSIAFYCFITAFEAQEDSAENNPPKVRISTAPNNNRFQWNAMVNYTISVSDKEDGTSEYDEIAAGEVLLKVVYLRDSSKVKKYLLDKANNGDIEHAGLSLIKTSACFTCHAAKNKLIGPSFELIAKRYPNNATSIETLAKKLMKGSTGVWGNIPMPSNPDLKTAQAREIIRWILKNNTNPDVTYLTGIQGAFRTKQKPETDSGKAAYILTASYTDHGLKGLPQLSKGVQHTIILKNY
jgi:cytochrome c